MKVSGLIEHLKTLPPDGDLIGQYHTDKGWMSVPVDERWIVKVPGNNNLVVFQLIPLGHIKTGEEIRGNKAHAIFIDEMNEDDD